MTREPDRVLGDREARDAFPTMRGRPRSVPSSSRPGARLDWKGRRNTR